MENPGSNAGRFLFARKCSWCDEGMNEGYVIHAGLEHYCCDECLFKKYDPMEYDEMYDDGAGDSYYTLWEDDEDMEYELVDGKLIDLY